MATRATCVRALNEALGISISPNRLRPAIASSKKKGGREDGYRQQQQTQGQQIEEADGVKEEEVIVETLIAFKKRFFFVLELNDSDESRVPSHLPNTHVDDDRGRPFFQQFGDNPSSSSSSSNFTKFCFEQNSIKAIELLEKQSGGQVSKALWMALKVAH